MQRADERKGCASSLLKVGCIAALIACSTFSASDDDPKAETDAGVVSDGATTNDAANDGGTVPADAGEPDGEASTVADSGRAPPCSPASSTCQRVIFATTSTTTGGMGGLAGADIECNSFAGTPTALVAQRMGRFHAWLSINGIPAPKRFVSDAREITRPDGAVVATGLADLTNSSLLGNPINMTPEGNIISSAPPHAWTGTAQDGNVSNAGNCSGWTMVDGNGRAGNPTQATAAWTDFTTQSCDTKYRLYCLEE